MGKAGISLSVFMQGTLQAWRFLHSLTPRQGRINQVHASCPGGAARQEGCVTTHTAYRCIRQNHVDEDTVLRNTRRFNVMPNVQAVLRDKSDATEMRLVYANQTEEDILLRKELDAMAKDWRLTIHYILSRPEVRI